MLWHKKETAPKDGTIILTWRQSDDAPFSAYYDRDHDDGVWRVPDGVFEDSADMEEDFYWTELSPNPHRAEA